MSRFARLAHLAAAAVSAEPGKLLPAAQAVAEKDGPEVVRAVLQQFHLFRGFPAALRALNLVAKWLPLEHPNPGPQVDLQGGETLFRRLYGKDATRVLQHMEQLEPILGQWILDHAYGRVMKDSSMSLQERERLALLWLAGDGYWEPWESHRRVALRLGIPLASLIADAHRFGWPEQGVTESLDRLRAQKDE